MSDLMRIIDQLREAAVSTRKECDMQVDKTLSDISRNLKDNIISHRDKQLEERRTLIASAENELSEMKNKVNKNAEKFETLKKNLNTLLENHKAAKQDFETKINTIQLRYKKNKAKQEKIDIKELKELHKALSRRLTEKLKSCKALMLKQDETLVKINSMLEG